MNCSAIRRMLRRATRASTECPNGTLSARSTPRSRARGTSTPSKYSARCRATSSLPSRAGKTSTNRNSCVLKAGRDIAQSSIRSLHQDMRKTLERSPVPSSASRRASTSTSPSRAWLMRPPYPCVLGVLRSREPQQPRDAVIAPGGVATVHRDGLACHERRIVGQQERRDRGDLLRPSEPLELVLLAAQLHRSLHPVHAEDALRHGRVDEARADAVGADAHRAVVDGEVLREDDHATLRRLVRAASSRALETFDACDRDDRAT